jgi:hypothetical protein
LADDAAAHRVAVNVGAVDLQVIHQLDHVLRPSRSAGDRLVALSVIAIVNRHDAVPFGNLGRDAGVEPHALRGIGIAMNQHHPRSAVTMGQVVDLDAVAGREEVALLSDLNSRRSRTGRRALLSNRGVGDQDGDESGVCRAAKTHDSPTNVSGILRAT